jgi:hypothetical protein
MLGGSYDPRWPLRTGSEVRIPEKVIVRAVGVSILNRFAEDIQTQAGISERSHAVVVEAVEHLLLPAARGALKLVYRAHVVSAASGGSTKEVS